ncbi:MAG: hypothetical protein EAZ70_11280 [Runella slithyformis]|jgi:hypothetical protein|nr:MAG: hypothetical protein EAY79_11570 [Runella slithyformis]TAE94641.1 MAG: hypothetical protein EAZ80_10115 [Runella slithyformis]TAF24810.1 MAG: hypothetical protein EAZ70_11280 [Runella slithyformis]TAF49653.1 MAG: hypothetical protein EAZ63_00780 [Runella slithyformis]TAF81059.1 MAG: hypothetical protein EAZ50_07395 [Runella slithyformis]
MAIISKKKIPFRINGHLREYLEQYNREVALPIQYASLLRFDNAIPLYDKKGSDTFWETVFYSQADIEEVYLALKLIYADLKADGDMSVMKHLYVDRVDLCSYGNSKPFRVRIVNKVNDNFDYFYLKNADASRIYGLELEHILSPNRISYLTSGDTLVEEHIAGVPGDMFMKSYLQDPNLNAIRLCKEFVKFNERCFVRLLGDMHSSNFVVDITPDFEEVYYRIRSIDFDQQSYEGKKVVYMPQYFKQNNALIDLGFKYLTTESVLQYQKEERSLIAGRLRVEGGRIKDLMNVMIKDRISLPQHTEQLKQELAKHYRNSSFLNCVSMGDIVQKSLDLVMIH